MPASQKVAAGTRGLGPLWGNIAYQRALFCLRPTYSLLNGFNRADHWLPDATFHVQNQLMERKELCYQAE
jgi:hypothetical protein